MCLKGFKLKPKTPQCSKKWLEVKFCGCLWPSSTSEPHEQKYVHLPEYLSIGTDNLRKFHTHIKEKKVILTKNTIWEAIFHLGWKSLYKEHSALFTVSPLCDGAKFSWHCTPKLEKYSNFTMFEYCLQGYTFCVTFWVFLAHFPAHIFSCPEQL